MKKTMESFRIFTCFYYILMDEFAMGFNPINICKISWEYKPVYGLYIYIYICVCVLCLFTNKYMGSIMVYGNI